jgi:hypothetical protein
MLSQAGVEPGVDARECVVGLSHMVILHGKEKNGRATATYGFT